MDNRARKGYNVIQAVALSEVDGVDVPNAYGHHSVWQMYDKDKGRGPINRPLMPWYEAIDQPAAGQALFLKLLMESRPKRLLHGGIAQGQARLPE